MFYLDVKNTMGTVIKCVILDRKGNKAACRGAVSRQEP